MFFSIRFQPLKSFCEQLGTFRAQRVPKPDPLQIRIKRQPLPTKKTVLNFAKILLLFDTIFSLSHFYCLQEIVYSLFNLLSTF